MYIYTFLFKTFVIEKRYRIAHCIDNVIDTLSELDASEH